MGVGMTKDFQQSHSAAYIVKLASEGKLSVSDFDDSVISFYRGAIANANALLNAPEWRGTNGENSKEFIDALPDSAQKDKFLRVHESMQKTQEGLPERIDALRKGLNKYFYSVPRSEIWEKHLAHDEDLYLPNKGKPRAFSYAFTDARASVVRALSDASIGDPIAVEQLVALRNKVTAAVEVAVAQQKAI
jgi:hypothetical protein